MLKGLLPSCQIFIFLYADRYDRRPEAGACSVARGQREEAIRERKVCTNLQLPPAPPSSITVAMEIKP